MKKIALITNVFEEVNFGSGGERVFYEFIKKEEKKSREE